MKLYLATTSAHKLREVTALLMELAGGAGPLVLASASEAGGMPPVDENAPSFAGNARLKASALWAALGGSQWVVADDSGLCVDALEGGPGIRSARYAGAGASDRQNLEKLLRTLQGIPPERRAAHFTCALVLLGPDGVELTAEGECRGRLLESDRGTGGFGYDPIFVPEGYGETFAELPEEEKNKISHRGRAWRALLEQMRERGLL